MTLTTDGSAQEQHILDLLYSKVDRPFTISNIIHGLPWSSFSMDFTYEDLKENIQNLLRKQLICTTKAWIFDNDWIRRPEDSIAYCIPHFENSKEWKKNYLRTKILTQFYNKKHKISQKIQDIVFKIFNVHFTKVSCHCEGCNKLTINQEWLGSRLYAFKGFRMFVGEFK